MTVVELRGPCEHLAAKLDTDRGIIQFACRQCSYDERRRVVHWFSAHDGTQLETIKPFQGELSDDGSEPGERVID